MTEGIRKASGRRRKAGKPARQGKGSHSVLQRVVGRLIASVQIADERMGFVQVSAVCAAGGIAACHPWARSRNNAPVNAHGIAPRHARGQSDPLPPYPTPSAAGVCRNFSPLF
jgi:hypothetical protein